MRNEALARADAALTKVNDALRSADLAERVDRIIASAALGAGFTAHMSVELQANRTRRTWANFGCTNPRCGCDPIEEEAIEALVNDYETDAQSLLVLREVYSYEMVEAVAWSRTNTVQLTLDIGGTDTPEHTAGARVKDAAG